jgi:hypothetical protein
LQLFTKIVHFTTDNLILARYLSPEHLGVSSLQFPLVSMIFTRIMKEALHRAAVKEKYYAFVWWSVPLSMILSSFFGILYVSSAESADFPWFKASFTCWIISGWLELIIEPVIIYIECESSNPNVVVIVESSALLSNSFSLLILLQQLSADSSVLAVAIGQLIYGIVLTLGYYYYAFIINPSAWTTIRPSSSPFNTNKLKDAGGFIVNSLGKYIAAEGERILLLFVASTRDQGVFQFVSNLGGFVARIVFLSVEKTGFVTFKRNAKEKEKREAFWKLFLEFSILVSLLYLATCPNYINVLLRIVYGDKWSDTNASTLFNIFGVYLLCIGINGLTESLRDSMAPPEKMNKSWWFTPISIGILLRCTDNFSDILSAWRHLATFYGFCWTIDCKLHYDCD